MRILKGVTSIFIPNKLKVGFQKRNDTYTKKLAYVIYYDQNNKLRKEDSWSSWRDENIEPIEFENVPTSGFVLNKKAGGYATGWNHRQTYCRVYDPRDFEFEISISNLLFILENTNSIKGKGLEGNFVYGWDGKDLMLIPTGCPDYKKLQEYNNLLFKKEFIKSKDLTIGATYRHTNNSQLIYMGRFNHYNMYNGTDEGLNYFFYNGSNLETFKSISGKLIQEIDNTCVSNYSELFEKLESDKQFSPIDKTKDEYISYDYDEFTRLFESKICRYFYSNIDGISIREYHIDYWGDRVSIGKCSESGYTWGNNEYITVSCQEIFDKYKPMYINKYLSNGKFYGSSKEGRVWGY